jgi:hypothetical protein
MLACFAQRILGLLPHSNGTFRFTVKKHYLKRSTDSLLAAQQSPREFATCVPNFGYISELIINYVSGSHPLQVNLSPETAGSETGATSKMSNAGVGGAQLL